MTNKIEIPELKIKITKVIHKGKSYNEIMELKKENERLLRIEEVIFLANSKYAKGLNIFSGNNDFLFEQPINYNKKNDFVSWFIADSGRAFLSCGRVPGNRYYSLGVIFVEDIIEEAKPIILDNNPLSISKYAEEYPENWEGMTNKIEIPELKIKITKVIHKGKSYNEIMELKKENERLLRIEEVIFLANSKYAKGLNIFSGNNDFLFEQPRDPDDRNDSLGVIFAEDIIEEAKPIILDNNPLSISKYAEEYPENWEGITRASNCKPVGLNLKNHNINKKFCLSDKIGIFENCKDEKVLVSHLKEAVKLLKEEIAKENSTNPDVNAIISREQVLRFIDKIFGERLNEPN